MRGIRSVADASWHAQRAVIAFRNGGWGGDAFRKANAAGSKDTVVFTDLKTYFPSYEAPAGFVASPIFKDGKKIGILMFQFPLDSLNAIMKTRAGMGQTGETYLVGSDLLMRSDSYLNPEDHSVVASYKHPEKGKVDTEAVQEALKGKTGEDIITDYNGNPVLSAYTPLSFEGLQWALLAEIDAAEAFAAVKALQWVAMVVTLVGVVAIVAIALLITRSITLPVKRVVANLTDLAQGEGDLTVRTCWDADRLDLGRVGIRPRGMGAIALHAEIGGRADTGRPVGAHQHPVARRDRAVRGFPCLD